MRPIDADNLKAEMKFECQTEHEETLYSNFMGLEWDSIEAVIDDAPTLDEWFPVNEKLPDEEGLYLVTAVYGDRKVMTIGAYWVKGNWDLEEKDKNLTVACWTKLPEEE